MMEANTLIWKINVITKNYSWNYSQFPTSTQLKVRKAKKEIMEVDFDRCSPDQKKMASSEYKLETTSLFRNKRGLWLWWNELAKKLQNLLCFLE